MAEQLAALDAGAYALALANEADGNPVAYPPTLIVNDVASNELRALRDPEFAQSLHPSDWHVGDSEWEGRGSLLWSMGRQSLYISR